MKHYFRFAISFIFFFTFIVGCKRETFNEKGKAESGAGARPGQQAGSLPGNIPGHKATAEEIEAAKKAWLSTVRKPNVAARGGCGENVSSSILLTNAVKNSCGDFNMYYTIWSYDLVGSGYELQPVTASFIDYTFSPLSATLLNSSATLVDPDCKAWEYDGYCDMIREYQYVVFNVPFPGNTPSSVGTFSLDLLSGFASNCTPLTVSGNLDGTFNYASYYSGQAARVYVPPVGTGSIFIGTDCSLLCYSPYLCPNFGTFQYWNNTINQTITIPTSGYILSGLAPDTYNFSVTLTYTIGGNTVVSLPLTRPFTKL